MCVKRHWKRNTYTFCERFEKVLYLESYIISLCTCIDATYTFVCVYEIVRIARDKNGWTPWAVFPANCKGIEAQ